MSYKVFDRVKYEKLFSNTFCDLNDLDVYSFYRYGVECYLNKILFLKEFNDVLENSNMGVYINTFYYDMSNFDYKYVCLVNNFYLNKLSSSDYLELKDIFNSNDFERLLLFVKRTFKSIMDNNGILILGVCVKRDKRVLSFLKEKLDVFLETINIPVNFVNFYEELLCKQSNILRTDSKYLPLGSIVLLKEAVKKLMIIGYSIIDLDDKSKIYDYIGCLYPEGTIDTKTNIVFNHEDIEVIIALGIKDDEVNNFNFRIKGILEDEEYMKKVLDSIK